MRGAIAGRQLTDSPCSQLGGGTDGPGKALVLDCWKQRVDAVVPRQDARGVFSLNDIFLLTYLYCLNGSVEKAEALAVANVGSIKRNWFVDWLWKKLESDFGFHPPG